MAAVPPCPRPPTRPVAQRPAAAAPESPPPCGTNHDTGLAQRAVPVPLNRGPGLSVAAGPCFSDRLLEGLFQGRVALLPTADGRHMDMGDSRSPPQSESTPAGIQQLPDDLLSIQHVISPQQERWLNRGF